MLERDGRGLNLTWEVRDGILTTPAGEPATLEGRIVRLVDRVAYINHDIDDALRAGVLAPADLPADEIALLGGTGSKRIDTLVHDLVETSAGRDDIVQSAEIGEAMLEPAGVHVRARVPRPGGGGRAQRAAATVRRIFDYFAEHPEELPPTARRPAAAGHGLRRRHDRPLRARMALIKPASVRRWSRRPTSSRSSSA